MRVAFLGTPEAALPTLRALVREGHDVALVVTRADCRRGRGSELSASPVKSLARSMGLRVSHQLSDVLEVSVERGVVVAYGALVPAAVLAQVPMVNVHFSLLPRWRGAAPVERAILAGDRETGVSVMTMEAGLDTGPVHLERRVVIAERDATALRDELALIGAEALVEVLASATLLEHARPQEGEVLYAHKLTRADRVLDPSESVELFVRRCRVGGAELRVRERRLVIERAVASASSVEPGAVRFDDGNVLAGCADGAVRWERVRPEGGASMTAPAWWRGRMRDDRSATWSSTGS